MTPDPKTGRHIHPEAAPDEVCIGNMFACDFPKVGWTTKRMSVVCYETGGGQRITTPGFRPVFVARSELEAAGCPIPARGPIDPKWYGLDGRSLAPDVMRHVVQTQDAAEALREGQGARQAENQISTTSGKSFGSRSERTRPAGNMARSSSSVSASMT